MDILAVKNAARTLESISRIQKVLHDMADGKVSARFVRLYPKSDPTVISIYGDNLTTKQFDELYSTMYKAGLDYIQGIINAKAAVLSSMGVDIENGFDVNISDTSVCPICDGGPGNNCACSCEPELKRDV